MNTKSCVSFDDQQECSKTEPVSCQSEVALPHLLQAAADITRGLYMETECSCDVKADAVGEEGMTGPLQSEYIAV